MNTLGYHRYMRGVWFISGMFTALLWSSWLMLALAVLLVSGRAMWDIVQEEHAARDLPGGTDA